MTAKDLTSFVQTHLGQTGTLQIVAALISQDQNGIVFYSKEAGNNQPQLSMNFSDIVYAVNCGDGTFDYFSTDNYFSGGFVSNTTTNIDSSIVALPAPTPIYQACRSGSNFSYLFPGLNPNGTYTVRLHFADIQSTNILQRQFNVIINGNTVLSEFDIFGTLGQAGQVVVGEFNLLADAQGKIQINFAGTIGNALCCGIEIKKALPFLCCFSWNRNLKVFALGTLSS